MLSKREWDQVKQAILMMHSPKYRYIANLAMIYRKEVLELLEHWVEEENE